MIKTADRNRITSDRPFPPVKVAKRVGSLASDMIELAELQFELLKADVAESKRRIILPAILLVLGITVVLAVIPVALIALGYFLVETAGLSHAASMAISSACGMVVSIALLLGAFRLFSRVTDTFNCSQTEFSRNVNWIKETLRSSE